MGRIREQERGLQEQKVGGAATREESAEESDSSIRPVGFGEERAE